MSLLPVSTRCAPRSSGGSTPASASSSSARSSRPRTGQRSSLVSPRPSSTCRPDVATAGSSAAATGAEDGTMSTDRWSAYTDLTPTVSHGWTLETVTPPSRLGGANGMTVGPDGRLYVTQVFFSQVTAIDVDSGVHEVF